jgi:small conductance mechanosensitive channel
MEDITAQLISFATTYGLKVVGAILILILGRFFAGIARKIVRRITKRANVDDAVGSFLASATYFLVIAFAVIAALAKFGMQTASLVAVLGAVGFAVGFALQGSLSNFAAGVMLLVFRPFKVGDLIEAAGVLGIVQDIHLFNTVIATLDNVKIIVPNGKVYGDVIKNISGYDTRRVDLVFGIGYSSSIPKAYDVIRSILKEDARILPEPETQIAVSELADSSVNFVVRPWVKSEDYWDVRFDLTRQVKEAFDSQGIEIPFPQHVVHMATEGEN